MSLGRHTGYPRAARWVADLVYDLLRGLARAVSWRWRKSVAWHAPLPDGPVLLAINHPTSLDPFVVASLIRRRMVFLTSYKLFHVPGLKMVLKAAGMVSAGAGDPRRALRGAIEALQAGYALCVFPEGRISPETGEVAHPRSGAARIALRARVPVVPVGIYAPAEHLRLLPVKVAGRQDKIRWYGGGPYAVTFGEPLMLDGRDASGREVRALSQEIAQRIAALAAESRGRVEPEPEAALGDQAHQE